MHFFDGFRTSHELNTLDMLSDDDLRAYVPEELILDHRRRALSPEHPYIRGTAQNPDTYFQSRETVNPFYAAVPGLVSEAMDEFAELTGRRYSLVEYHGDPDATDVIVIMGSGAQTTMRRPSTTSTRTARRSASSRSGSTGRSRSTTCWPRSPRRASASPSWTARRSPAPAASRCSSTSPARWPRPWRPDAARPCRGSSAAATACPARSSPPAWSWACSTNSPRRPPARGSPSASTTTSRC